MTSAVTDVAEPAAPALPVAAAAPAAAPRVRRRLVLALVLLLAPALPWIGLLPRFGHLPANDYYGILPQVLATDGSWRHDAAAWLDVRSNEHPATVPALLYAANARLTHGDDLALSAWALLMLAGTGVLLLALLRRGWEDARTLPLAAALVGVLLFAPAQVHCLALGFSGTIWLTANLLVVASIVAFVRHARGGGAAPLALALALAVLGLWTYSTCASLWPALLAGALLLRVRRATLVTVAVTGAAVLAAFAWRYSRPGSVPPPRLDDAPALALFVLRYLGGLWSHQWVSSALCGALVLAASLALWIAGPLRSARHAPWAMLQVYVLFNAVGTAAGRLGLGAVQALNSRYAALAALFWIGLLVPAAALLLDRRASPAAARPATLVAGAFVVLFLAAGQWAGAEQDVRAHVVRADAERGAIAVLWHPMAGSNALYPVSPVPQEVWKLRPWMVAHRQVPFDRPEPFAVGAPLAASMAPVGNAFLPGVVARRQAVRGGWQLVGKVHTQRRVDWVVLVDPAGVVRGYGGPALVPVEDGIPRANVLFVAYAPAPAAVGELRALVLLAGDRRLVPLRNRGADLLE